MQHIIDEADQNQTPSCLQTKIHVSYHRILVLKLYHDCTQKQQDPLRTNVFRLQAIMAYYHFVGEAGLICSICSVVV